MLVGFWVHTMHFRVKAVQSPMLYHAPLNGRVQIISRWIEKKEKLGYHLRHWIIYLEGDMTSDIHTPPPFVYPWPIPGRQGPAVRRIPSIGGIFFSSY